VPLPAKRRKAKKGHMVSLKGATGNNLQNVSVDIPLGVMTCVTGVSGSGKSTLILDTFYKAAARAIMRTKDIPMPYKDIRGLEHVDKVIDIDQSPIGRTPRSNPATYTGAFTHIRDWYAGMPEAKTRGYNAHLCRPHIPRRQSLEVKFKGKSIADVLGMTIDDACEFFKAVPTIRTKMETLQQVGLGYIKVGQQANTLSGGEAQRVKLSKELAKRSTGKTLYILDEPTTGLHFEDVKKLLEVLHTLVDQGNSVVIIEHNLEVVKTADHIIDVGPEGGTGGGQIMATGTPEDIVKVKESYTAEYLAPLLKSKSSKKAA